MSIPANWAAHLPAELLVDLKSQSHKAEGFHIRVLPAEGKRPAVVLVVGNDSRGAMFGAGKLLRSLKWGSGTVRLAADFTIDLAPDREIRGHQIGYRPTANSYDAWTLEQLEQYFRDMVIFGANAVESIPLHEALRH